MQRRREVLRDVVSELSRDYSRFHSLAQGNLQRWSSERKERGESLPRGCVEVRKGDWGEVTLALTQRWGLTFPVLNMANAHVAGGAYRQGAAAQEENMFRRTDCHLALRPEELQPAQPGQQYAEYRPETTQLLNAADGSVSLDLEQPRVCIRGPEERTRSDLGYEWLAAKDVFPFFELKAAAVDLRDGTPFDRTECVRRFRAILNTLEQHDQRNAVLGAHGCGAFGNPSAEVADCFREVLEQRRDRFDLVVFAIFHAGYGPGNYAPFSAAFESW